MENYRAGYVALLGRPNVGKSSIINALIKEKVVAVSSKAQTTRSAVRCIYTSENEQIVFVDTPGIHTPKHALGDFMLQEATEALSQVDIICFVIEASDRSIGKKEEMILSVLEEINTPVIIIVNKIDIYEDSEMYKKAVEPYLDRIKPLTIIPVSALKMTNLDNMSKEIASYLPIQPKIYPEEMIMDSTERFLASEIIREKIFNYTEEEVPHGVAVLIDEYKTPEEFPELKTSRIMATIIVEKQGQKGIIIGKAGSKLKQIGTSARKELEKATGGPVFLQLWVKVKPGWKKSQEELRRLGYYS
ncbi:MAG: GTPase Era [Synergistaceae bacterium]